MPETKKLAILHRNGRCTEPDCCGQRYGEYFVPTDGSSNRLLSDDFGTSPSRWQPSGSVPPSWHPTPYLAE